MTRRIALALAPLLVAGALFPGAATARRPVPDTTSAIQVWDDQLPDSMTAAQVRFVVTHVDGTQKVSLQTAQRLRTINPGFLVLYYTERGFESYSRIASLTLETSRSSRRKPS